MVCEGRPKYYILKIHPIFLATEDISKASTPVNPEPINLQSFIDKEYREGGDRNWVAKFERIKRCKEDNGHFNVYVYNETENKNLVEWMREQRNAYLKFNASPRLHSSLTQERVNALKAIGFDFDPKAGNSVNRERARQMLWNYNLQELRKFKEERGDFPSCSTSLRLGKWVSKQRGSYKRLKAGLSSPMTLERIDALETLGFRWNVDKDNVEMGKIAAIDRYKEGTCGGKRKRSTTRHLRWHGYLEELHKFKKEHGGFPSFSTSLRLGKWISMQRRNYKRLKAGLSSAMTQERIDALEAIGFRWTVNQDNVEMGKIAAIDRDKKDTCSGKRKKSTTRHLRWHGYFEELHKFKKEHGDFPSFSTSLRLGKWMSMQRRNYKLLKAGLSTAMTQVRIDDLEAIGFRWTVDKDNVEIGKIAAIDRDRDGTCSGKRKSSSEIMWDC